MDNSIEEIIEKCLVYEENAPTYRIIKPTKECLEGIALALRDAGYRKLRLPEKKEEVLPKHKFGLRAFDKSVGFNACLELVKEMNKENTK